MSFRLHHVGVIAPNPNKNSRLLVDSLQQQIVLRKGGSTLVASGTDLLLEWSDGSSLGNPKSGIHHIAFAVEHVQIAYNGLIESGLKSGMSPRQNTFGRHAAVLDDNGLLIELVEPADYLLPPAPPQQPIPFQLHHVNILTDDWRRTQAFYETHFGLKTVFEYVDENDGAFLFLADPFFNFAQHNVLLEITGPPYAEQREHDFFAKHGSGIDHICYTAADVDLAWQKLIDNGASNLSKPYDAYGSRLAWVKDHDGNDIELMTPVPEEFFSEQ